MQLFHLFLAMLLDVKLKQIALFSDMPCLSLLTELFQTYSEKQHVAIRESPVA